jgi:hypothetical protein
MYGDLDAKLVFGPSHGQTGSQLLLSGLSTSLRRLFALRAFEGRRVPRDNFTEKRCILAGKP